MTRIICLLLLATLGLLGFTPAWQQHDSRPPLRNRLSATFTDGSPWHVAINLPSVIHTPRSKWESQILETEFRWDEPTKSDQWVIRIFADVIDGSLRSRWPFRNRTMYPLVSGKRAGRELVIQLSKGQTSLRVPFKAVAQSHGTTVRVRAFLCNTPQEVVGLGTTTVIVPPASPAGWSDDVVREKDGGYVPITQVEPPTHPGSLIAAPPGRVPPDRPFKGTIFGNTRVNRNDNIEIRIVYGPKEKDVDKSVENILSGKSELPSTGYVRRVGWVVPNDSYNISWETGPLTPAKRQYVCVLFFFTYPSGDVEIGRSDTLLAKDLP